MTRMFRTRGRHLRTAGLAGVSFLCLQAGMAGQGYAATEIIDSQFDTCTSINCGSTSVAGFVASFGNSVTPWVAKFLGSQGNCLRLDVSFVRQGDLEMVVVGPDGKTAYRADGGGTAGATAPLVKIGPVPKLGYYTVTVSSANGATINTDFHLLFGQYNSGNPNCASPTTPLP